MTQQAGPKVLAAWEQLGMRCELGQRLGLALSFQPASQPGNACHNYLSVFVCLWVALSGFEWLIQTDAGADQTQWPRTHSCLDLHALCIALSTIVN